MTNLSSNHIGHIYLALKSTINCFFVEWHGGLCTDFSCNWEFACCSFHPSCCFLGSKTLLCHNWAGIISINWTVDVFLSGNCDSGYYCPIGEITPNRLPCPVGYKCPAGSDAPILCPNGEYQELTGQPTCDQCPGGYYCDNSYGVVNISSDILCPSGYYCPPGVYEVHVLDFLKKSFATSVSFDPNYKLVSPFEKQIFRINVLLFKYSCLVKVYWMFTVFLIKNMAFHLSYNYTIYL